MKNKMQFKKTIILLLAVTLVFSTVTVYGDSTAFAKAKKTGKQAISIVYTTDIHGCIANDTSGDGLRISNISQKVKDMRADGKNVVLLDAGDAVQGSSYAGIDCGKSVVDIMNAAGYQLSAIGNHDFDYGVSRLFSLSRRADFKYLCCNFRNAAGMPCFPSTRILRFGGTKIAFVGITTPSTLKGSTPAFFQDDEGEWIYSFDGNAKANDLYKTIQKSVNAARKKADYVVAVSHTGIGREETSSGIDAVSLIKHTTGIDVFISGHSHEIISEWKKNKKGRKVLLTQAGSYMETAGVVTIKKSGGISNRFFTHYDKADTEVSSLEENLIARVQEQFGRKISTLDTTLTINDPKTGKRRVRADETNGGDFACDALYWYINEKKGLDCDAVIINGGGLRCDVPSGDVTINDLKNVQPFGNTICLISATGQQIKDALELGAMQIGNWNEENDAPAENGAFLQVAGLKYSIDAGTKSSVKLDEESMFVSVDGKYKVNNIEIYNRKTGEYEPLDPDRKYSLGGYDYILRENGVGMTMFAGCSAVSNHLCEDIEPPVEYAGNFKTEDGYPKINTANSALSAYKGYLLDYENPCGSGRITIK